MILETNTTTYLRPAVSGLPVRVSVPFPATLPHWCPCLCPRRPTEATQLQGDQSEVTRQDYLDYLKETGQEEPKHLRNRKPDTRTMCTAERIENERQQLLQTAAAKLDEVHAEYGLKSDWFKHTFADYLHLVKLGRLPRPCSGMVEIPYHKMNEVNALYLALTEGEDISDPPPYGKKQSHQQKKKRLCIDDYHGCNAGGEFVPFSYFVNALIKGKTKEFKRAEFREAKARVTVVDDVDELQPGELTLDLIVLDEAAADLEESRYVNSDGELFRRLELHKCQYLHSQDKVIAWMFLEDKIGNFSEIARQTGIDRRKVAESINSYIDRTVRIAKSRARELGHDDSDAAVKRLLGIGGGKSHPRGHVVETWKTRRNKPGFEDNGWNGYRIGKGGSSETA
jgi:hypothetical protein